MDQLTTIDTERENRAPLGFKEFVGLVAAMMALTALGIDSMLPALPAIGDSLDVATANHRQYVITSFLIGFAFAQLVYGPLSDRFGRRPVLLVALGAYVLTSAVAAISGSFELLLLSRAAMGTAAAGARVVTVALVRDCYSGRAMARVMSLAFIVFMAAPIVAPNFGELMLLFGNWRLIFWGVAGVSGLVMLWFWLRMPETMSADARQSLHPARIARDYALVMKDRAAVGYTLAITLLSGGMFGFIGSIQQIMADVFHQPKLLTVMFAAVASMMAVGAYMNSRLVMRLGMRLISHSALAVLIVLAGLHLLVAWSGAESLWTFGILQGAMMLFIALANANFSAMAMERMGDIAGTASSLQGFTTTLGGALIGALIGQAFNGTTVPLYAGFFILGVLAFGIIAVAERGRLFRAT
ncbi:multidrug effflux MFS transporter [Sphingomonas sp. G-3-2-10]|uniref:multidrug effflux MFS transporter n=1 Tax=Sphingomonas sp. G-3-2-10 TaxID=2728838 RepID=UPI00146F0059|nr:multidrug effflux MFS transporter [Sphingomonas sp. G-3-2-10]NML07627.1 multidrug effflux MFS transporter [Sphingomonas sp. G-3-2-10]